MSKGKLSFGKILYEEMGVILFRNIVLCPLFIFYSPCPKEKDLSIFELSQIIFRNIYY